MSWIKEAEQFVSDILWSGLLIVIVSASALGGLWLWRHFNNPPGNDSKVLHSFVEEHLEECYEKLGAYGEPVNLGSFDVSAEALGVCYEKLGAYGEPVDLPIKLHEE